jgi:hypothetical protein
MPTTKHLLGGFIENPMKKMKKKLIICPNCEKKGQREILGEVEDNKTFNVLRFHRGLTKIIAKEFIIVCGKCNELVFIRRKC